GAGFSFPEAQFEFRVGSTPTLNRFAENRYAPGSLVAEGCQLRWPYGRAWAPTGSVAPAQNQDSETMPHDPLGKRMKCYERAAEAVLAPRLPVIIRLDGNSFSRLTRKLRFNKPFDERF